MIVEQRTPAERTDHRAWSGGHQPGAPNLRWDHGATGQRVERVRGRPGPWSPPDSPDDVERALRDQGYLPGEGLSTAIFLAIALRRPLFLEGEPGVGKTEVGNALARWLGSPLVRLQCYEGIDAHQAIYEWDYQRQLLYLRAHDRGPGSPPVPEDELFSERFLIRRPLLQAIAGTEGSGAAPPVLLIDEIDRADDEFEAFLLEILADFTVTVPEVGTFRAQVPPVVVLTSNRTRDVHDALKRRALYHWVEHPDFEREVAIVLSRVPEAGEQLARQVTLAVQALRSMGLVQVPRGRRGDRLGPRRCTPSGAT